MKKFFYVALCVLCLGAFQACGGDSDEVVNPSPKPNPETPEVPERPDPEKPEDPDLPIIPTPKPEDVVEIKDPAFRAYLIEHYDRNNDSQLTYAEADLIVNLSLNGYKEESLTLIRSFEGISNLRNLTKLEIDFSISKVDLQDCCSLVELVCRSSHIEELALDNCIALEKLDCGGNQLPSLDLSGCSQLMSLSCYNNQLRSLDLSGCSQLTSLSCYNNQLRSLDLSGCSQLTELYCAENQLTRLNLSDCSQLKVLECEYNQLTSLYINKNTKIFRLNIRMNNMLETLYVWEGFSWENLYVNKDDNTIFVEIIAFP